MPDDYPFRVAARIEETQRDLPTLSIVGLGYIGSVSAACFAEMSFQVVAVDLDERKVVRMAAGNAPVVEVDLDAMVAQATIAGRITATTCVADAVAATDITFVCVGTPSHESGAADLSAVKAAAADIGRALARKDRYHLVVVRSTVPVGTTRGAVIPILETESGKRCGIDFGVCFHPEFLREGVAVADFFAPPKTVIGGVDARSAQLLASLYTSIEAPLVLTTIDTAEMVKYVDNTWHAVKVSFANEIGKICQSVRLDSHDVMGIFAKDTKLNLSAYYMRPGFAFGGSCLPKDVRALRNLANLRGIDVPLIDSILRSNDSQITHALDLIQRSRARRVGILGVTFKRDTDDLRESPQIDLIGRLLARGYEVRAYDRHMAADAIHLAAVHASAATAHTRAALDVLPSLMEEAIDGVVSWADLVVVCHNSHAFADAVAGAPEGTTILDLVGLPAKVRQAPSYSGIGW
jgi:GDP-mannose 6-dehydrogenase